MKHFVQFNIMRRINALLLSTCLVFCTGSVKKSSPIQTAKLSGLVELFTSEGCSSCPPADKLMEEINARNDTNVLILVYHVDYWDKLGWKDKFSSALNTQRQSYYAKIFGLNSVYTPQAIVNGTKELVGSDRNKLEEAMKPGWDRRHFQLKAQDQEKGKAMVTVSEAKLLADENIIVALVQKHAVTKIERGRNAGKEVSHVNIVRQFFSLTGENATATFAVDSQNRDDSFIAAFIQNKTSGKVSGFQTVSL